jgi:hypothetical protein
MGEKKHAYREKLRALVNAVMKLSFPCSETIECPHIWWPFD